MINHLKDALGRIPLVVGLAFAWYGLVAANDAIFQQFILTPYASLIYLPAALRIIFPLVFHNACYWGIILGGFLVTQGKVNDGLIDTVLLATSSGLAPYIGISVFKTLFETRPDLADLKPIHLVALALLCAASNAVLLSMYFAMSGRFMPPLTNLITILIGDIVGTIIVLYLASFTLTFFISRRRV
jgi:hypothetical protein